MHIIHPKLGLNVRINPGPSNPGMLNNKVIKHFYLVYREGQFCSGLNIHVLTSGDVSHHYGGQPQPISSYRLSFVYV